MTTNSKEPTRDIEQIGQLLKMAKEQNVTRLKVKLPFFNTSNHLVFITLKATWQNDKS